MIISAHIKSFRETFEGRASEWALAIIMLGWGLALVVNDTLFYTSPNLKTLAAMAPQDTWATAFLIVGSLRLVALAINGWWRRTPHIRYVTGFLSAGVWYLLSVGIWRNDAILPGTITYPVYFLLDMYNVWRAVGDAGWVDYLNRNRDRAPDDNA